jgi:hypothetical protein
MAQVHKKFTDDQVKDLLARYLKKELPRSYVQEILGIKRRRFCELVKHYLDNPDRFSIQYRRQRVSRRIDPLIEKNILKELTVEKKLIDNKDVPIRSYNYTYIQNRLENERKQKVSLMTIIRRAKEHGFYLKKPKRSGHDREVLTHYAGQLIQHDASFHLFAPAAREKWVLITSLDDYSRFMLYAQLLKTESSWAHIVGLQTVFLKYGLPFSYYVDSHSIFRFVRGRDSWGLKDDPPTDSIDTQWKQVLEDCGVKVIYALSPQAKGKIERPYQWLQDHLVRTCVRNNTTDIRQARTFLQQEVHAYNFRRVHSATLEVPHSRFQNALKVKKTLFREFQVRPPFRSVKDIFCLRTNRTTDSYRKVSINSLPLAVNGANPGDPINIRFYPMSNGLTELRFWRKDQLLDIQQLKSMDLKGVQF